MARILEWVAIPFSKRSSQHRDWTQVSCTAGGLHHLNHQATALNDLPNAMYFPSFHYSLLKFYFVSDAVLHSHFSQMERQNTFLSWERYKLPERRKSMFLITLLKKLLQTSLPPVVSSEKTADKSSITVQDCFKGFTDCQERPLPFRGRSLHHTRNTLRFSLVSGTHVQIADASHIADTQPSLFNK